MKNKRIITVLLVSAFCSTTVMAQESWDLRRCIDYAIAHNLTVKQREVAKQQREVDLNTAKWSRLPDVSGSASHSFNFGRSLQSNNTYESVNSQNTSMSLSVGLPVFTGFQIPHQVALSKLDLLAAVEDLNKAKEDITISVTSSYLQILYNMELRKIAQSQLELSKELYERKESFFRQGKASEAEVLEAKARMAQDELSLVQAENDYRLAVLDLSQLLELDTPDGLTVFQPDLNADDFFGKMESPATIYNEAVLSKPAILAAQYRVKGADHSIKIAQSGYYPKLSVGGGLGTNYYRMSGLPNKSFGAQMKDNFSQYIGLQLSVPIFDRFTTRNRVRSARLQKVALDWQLDESKKALFKEIQQAYYNAVGAESKYRSSELADRSAEASFRLMKEKYEYGKANASEYNESRTAWLRAQYTRYQAKYDYIFRMKILDFYRGRSIDL